MGDWIVEAVRVLVFFGIALSTTAPVFGSQIRRPLVVDDLLKQENYLRAVMDPTGRRIAFERTPQHDQYPDYRDVPSPSYGRIRIFDTAHLSEGSHLLLASESETLYRIIDFSPDGEYLALYAARRGEVSLVVFNFQTGRHQIFNGSPKWRDGLIWISDHELAYTRLPFLAASSRRIQQRLEELWSSAWRGENSATEISSHADGGNVKWQPGELIKLDVRTGKEQVLDWSSYRSLKVSPDGRWLTGLKEQIPPQPMPDQPVSLGDFFSTETVVFDLLTNQRSAGSHAQQQVAWRASSDSLPIYPEPTWSKPPLQASRLLRESSNLALYQTVTADGTELWLLRSGMPPQKVEEINQYFAGIVKPKLETIAYTVHRPTKKDVEIRSAVLLPNGYSPGKRYPVVVYTYPDVEPTSIGAEAIGQEFFFFSLQLLAAKGYIVFYPTTSVELTKTVEGPLTGLADVVLQGVDALSRQGYADPSRVNLIGHSQGGLTSLWLATQTDRFKAIISSNGWADLLGHYFRFGTYQVDLTDDLPSYGYFNRYEENSGMVGLNTTPWKDPAIFVRNSPVFQAHKIKTPVLLVHSDMDIFPVEQYEEMFLALYRLRKEATLVRYWGEGHGPSNPANVRDFWYRTFAWFDKWSDISRDSRGNLQWSGNVVRSRRGSPALSPEDFQNFERLLMKQTRASR